MALQRNLKALGTFGFQAATRVNPVYIQYIPRTLAYVRANLERHARFAPPARAARRRAAGRSCSLRSGTRWQCTVGDRRFGLSTHLFHDHRLTRDHLALVARHGFDAVEAVRHPHPLRLPRRRRGDAARRLAARDAARAALGARAHRRSGAARRDGGALLHGVRRRGPSRRSPSTKPRRRSASPRGFRSATWCCISACPRARTRPPTTTSPAAARRSLEEIVEAAQAVGVRVAVEVIPNALSTPARARPADRRRHRGARRRHLPRLRARAPDGRPGRGHRGSVGPPA